MGKISQRAKINPVEAKDNGEATVTGEDSAMLLVGECLVGEDGILVAEVVDLVDSIHWHVKGAGCVAIWPMTIPAPLHSR